MLLILLRATSLAACLSAFGAVAFLTVVRPGAPSQPPIRHLIRISLMAALLLNLAWLLRQTVVMADTQTMADFVAALPIVAFESTFGHVILLREAVLIATFVLAFGPPQVRLLVLVGAGAAVALQTGIAHAAARFDTDGPSLLISEVLHLWAAGAWLGGLAPLLICVARLPSNQAAAIARRFSPLGLACVLVLAGTGLLQAADLIGSPTNLIHTPYGRMALVKLSIFIALLVLALANRFAFVDHRRQLIRSLTIETALGGAVILAASQLGSLSPPVG